MSGTSPDTPTPDGAGASITALLERTTPRPTLPLDLDGVARRSRRRRQRKRAAAAGGAAALVALVVSATVASTGGDERAVDVDTAQEGADAPTLTEPVGSWSQATAPPFATRAGAFGGTLSDGRVLIWGGDTGEDDSRPPRALDGGIYDPDTGEWTAIPDAPLTGTGSGSSSMPSAQLVADRLAVVSESPEDGSIHAAVYDVAEGSWAEAPAQDDVKVMFNGMAWDGNTLALVRLDPGSDDFIPASQAVEGDAPSGPVEGGLDYRVDAPVTLRWSPGDPTWQLGAPAPLSLRREPGSAYDGSRLAIWGGTTTPDDHFETGPDPGLQADGAIYDVASDAWEPIADGPLSGRIHPGVAWSDGRLLVGGGGDRLVDPGEDFGDLAAYDPATGSWEELEGPPEGGVQMYPAIEHVAGRPQLVRAGTEEHRWFLGEDGWETAPAHELHVVGGFFVATMFADDGSGDGAFGVQVRAERDTWLAGAEAPFADRRDTTVVPTGDRLVVIGGADGAQLTSEVWVFDLSGD